MRLERVVIGIDFSEPSIAAARWAVRRFAPGAQIVLTHVISVPEPPRFLRGRFPPTDALVSTARDGAERRLKELSATLGADRVWLEVRSGAPSEEIARVASTYDADAIVVGAHGQRPGVWGRIGSTAEMLVRHSSVPVLLATGLRDAKIRHVLVALDDSEVAHAAARWANFVATRESARVTALHVVSAAVLGGVLAGAGNGSHEGEDDEHTREELRREADRWMGAVVGGALSAEQVGSEVRFGHPGEEILAAAERHDSDLIVVGSHGRGVASRLFVGSVAAEVLRGARCPVLTVKESEDTIAD
jgi:nucleotide-binding universal stress UspA family protein